MKYTLGIDVGGTKTAIALVDHRGKVSALNVVRTSQKNLLKQLKDLISVYKHYNELVAIGLAVPGQVLKDGTVTRLPNIKNFKPANLKSVLEKEFRLPVRVVNDAKAFAFAESRLGWAKQARTSAALALGTGIGVGFVLDGDVYHGKDGLAGEFDHVTLLPEGKLLREYIKKAGMFKNARAAKKYLTALLSLIVMSFNPEIIVISGGWTRLMDLEKVARDVAINLGGYRNNTPVKISRLEYPSLIGAALLALKK